MAISTLQNFYKETVAVDCTTGATNIYVSTKPTPINGYLVISPGSESLREIIKYTGTGTDGTGDYVTIALAGDRGLGGTTDQAHIAGEAVRMNYTAEHQQEIDDTIEAIVQAGAPNASTTVNGIVKVALDADVVAGDSTSGDGARLVIGVDSPYIAKLVKKRVTNEVSAAQPTINTDNTDVHQITALATDITSMSANLTGTPYLWDILVIDIVSSGDHTIGWGADFVSGDVYNLPTSLTTSQKLKVFFNWNGTKWSLIGFA